MGPQVFSGLGGVPPDQLDDHAAGAGDLEQLTPLGSSAAAW
ncbi:hypothetical protein [Streptomyces rameus]